LVTTDLIFSTKITGTARAVGLDMQVVGSPHAAAERLSASPASCVILDLGLPSITPDHIRAIVAAAAGSPVVAFGSHVDAAQLESARTAGCSDVMPRSRFAATLPQLLGQLVSGN
jgi:DNA-binding NarL/FixJ family response regulator